MKRYVQKLCLLMFLTVPSAYAEFSCDTDLQLGVLVYDYQIRVMQEGITQYQINHDSQLIVRGQLVNLEPAEQATLEEFSSGIRYSMPKIISLATEGIDLAINTVDHVYGNLVGSDNGGYDRMQSAMERVRFRVMKKYVHSGDYYYIGPRSLESMEDLVDVELEQELDNTFNTTIGGLLSVIGALESTSDGHTSANMAQRLETIGAALETEVGPKAQQLREKARWFCQKMHYLDELEEQLRLAIPELAPFNVIKTGTEVARVMQTKR